MVREYGRKGTVQAIIGYLGGYILLQIVFLGLYSLYMRWQNIVITNDMIVELTIVSTFVSSFVTLAIFIYFFRNILSYDFLRFQGEKPYSQSVFQFSLHVQSTITECDINNNHLEYLANNEGDEREALVKHLCASIGDKGSIIVWNASFEKGRIQELADLFPEYANKLIDIHSRIFDLMNVVDTKTSFYKEQGYTETEAKLPNFVHEDMQGSYSIKKVLPVFTDLSYEDLAISNGSVAMITYATLPQMTKADKEKTRSELIAYCRQDTWAMVEITKGIDQLIKEA